MRRVVLLVVLLGLALPAPAHAAFPGKNGKIAFVRSQLNVSPPLVYTMEPDGSGIAQLPIMNLARSNFPAWSPDGMKIAFTSAVGSGRTDIYVENADGGGQLKLTDDPESDAYPNWSPDGSKIVFTKPDAVGNAQIYVMNLDGSGQTKLTDNPTSAAFPAFSPDGTSIAFMKEVIVENHSRVELFVMNADGTGQTELSSPGFYDDAAPDWSPDGTRIVFFSNRDAGRAQVYVMNADGSAQTRLTQEGESSSVPAWSPDGSKIVFASSPDFRNFDIYLMNPDGTGKTKLTNAQSEQVNAGPDWQPIPEPKRSDYRNAAQFCEADRDFLGDEAFTKKYGSNGNGANAFGNCVSSS
jgi:Tol biopolymer transport system component